MGAEDGEVVELLLRRLPDRHGVGRRGGLEADGEEDDLAPRLALATLRREELEARKARTGLSE